MNSAPVSRHPPMLPRFPRGRIVGTSVVWAAAALLGAFHILDLVHCLLIAVCVTVLLIVWPQSVHAAPRLPDLPRHTHLGARRDLADLSWSATDADGRASAKALARVRQLTSVTELDGVRGEIDQSPSPSLNRVFRWLDSIDEKVKYD